MKQEGILKKKVEEAITTERNLQSYYQEMMRMTPDPEHRSVLRDLLLHNEMNEVLLRSMYRI